MTLQKLLMKLIDIYQDPKKQEILVLIQCQYDKSVAVTDVIIDGERVVLR